MRTERIAHAYIHDLSALSNLRFDDAIRIVYGYPASSSEQAEQRGEIVLGGCVIGPESPDYECRSCGGPLPGLPSPTTSRKPECRMSR